MAVSGYSYRKSHIINNATGADVNYQVKITVHYGNGTDSGGDVYLNNSCQADFDDVNFTDNDEVTPLDYWMETKVDSDYAIFWVEVRDNLTSTNQQIYVYYGKSDATTSSNGDNTFPIFIGHEEGNLNEWSGTIGGGTHSASTEHPHTGTYDYKVIPTTTPSVCGKYKTISAYDAGYAYRIWLYDVPTKLANYAESTYIVDTGTVEIYVAAQDTWDNYSYYDGAGWVNTSIARTAGFHYFEYRVAPTYILLVIDGTQVCNSTRLNEGSLNRFYAYAYGAKPNPSWFDDMIVRKFVYPEPTHGSWGAEECLSNLYQVSSSISPSIQLTTGKGASFSRLSNIPMQVSVNSLKAIALFKYASIPIIFALQSTPWFVQLTQYLNVYGLITPAFALNAIAEFVSFKALNIYGSIAESFAINSLKTVAFLRQAFINPTFTIQSFAKFISGQALNIWGSINAAFIVDSTVKFVGAVTKLNIYGVIGATFQIIRTITGLGVEEIDAAWVLAAFACIIGFICLALVFSQKQRRED